MWHFVCVQKFLLVPKYSFRCHRLLVRMNRCRLYQRHISFIIYQLEIVIKGYIQMLCMPLLLLLLLFPIRLRFFSIGLPKHWKKNQNATNQLKKIRGRCWYEHCFGSTVDGGGGGGGGDGDGNTNKCLFSHNLNSDV